MTSNHTSPSRTLQLPLAARCTDVQPSATSELFGHVAQLRAGGHEVLGLHVGEPDFDTPVHVVEAAQRALSEGATRYTPVRGLLALREAICEDSLRRRGGVSHTPDEVVVSAGAKQSLFHLALSLFGPGDEVIIPSPCWVSYPDQVRLAGAKAVVVSTLDDDFKLTPQALRAAITPATRGLILCTPNNPTGVAYSEAELRALAAVVAEQRLWVIADEIYSELAYNGARACSWLQAAPELRDRSVIVDGVSKRFAMTGFRIGWMFGPARVARACEVLQGQNTSSTAAVAQHAALAALRGPDADVRQMREAFRGRRQRVLDALGALVDVRCRPPDGAFYAFLDVRQRLARARGEAPRDDVELARLLLDRERVALVPGSAFLSPGFLRLSYAASDAVLDQALSRLARVLG